MKCVEGGNVGTARRTVHITYMFLESTTAPPPRKRRVAEGISPTAMWERATGRFDSPAATVMYTLRPSTSLQMPNIELHRPVIEPGPPL